jgi:hypothetical protein
LQKGCFIEILFLYLSINLKREIMAIGKKNSGFHKQGAVLAQFKKDANGNTNNSAVAQAIRAGVQKADYQKKLAEKASAPAMSYMFLTTGK